MLQVSFIEKEQKKLTHDLSYYSEFFRYVITMLLVADLGLVIRNGTWPSKKQRLSGDSMDTAP